MAIDATSETWLALAAYADKALARSLAVVAQEDIPERQADVARGEIKALNEILSLVKPRPDISGSAGGNT